ncbi:MAG: hypothetical protein Q9217_004923 [Psora testacea]
MAMATLSHRRRVTTYGKACSKTCDSSSFAADDFSQTPWNSTFGRLPNDISSRYEKDPAKMPLNTRFHTSSSGTVCKSKPNHYIKDVRSRPVDDISKDDNTMLYEFVSCEERGEQRTIGGDLERKRRKLISADATDQQFPVFDDDSLQRHIAAQVLVEMGGKVKRPYNTKIGHQARTRSKPVEHSVENRLKPSPVKRAQGREMKAENRQVKGAKVKKPFRKAYKAAENAPKSTGRPKTPDSALSDVASLQPDTQDEGNRPNRTQAEAPRTPLRPTRPTSVATTPRQRELWELLLVDDARSMSPSYLDLPVLQINESQPVIACKRTSYAMRPKIHEELLHAKSRGNRLIDTLHPSGRDLSPPKDDHSHSSGELASSSKSHVPSQCGESEGFAVHDILDAQTAPNAIRQNAGAGVIRKAPSATSHATACFQAGRLKFTYTHQRSYLDDHAFGEAAMFTVSPNEVPDQSWRHGLGAPKSQTSSTDGYDPDKEQDSQNGAIRSIHELREAGGNARLAGVLEASLDELDEAQVLSACARRSALINLVSKLQEASTCRLLVEKGLEFRLLAHVENSHDPITNSLFAAAILRLVAHSASEVLISKIDNTHIKTFLIQLLRSKQDLNRSARSRESNLPLLAQRDYTALCNSLLKSSIWRAGAPAFLSCQALSLQCLEYLVRRTRQGCLVAGFLSANQIQDLVETSIPSSRILSQQDGTALILLELAVSTIESCIFDSAHSYQQVWSESVLELVRGILPGLRSSLEERRETLEVATLRLYLNATNRLPSLCEAFARPYVIDAIFAIILSHFRSPQNGNTKHQKLLLDRAILALGCLINFAESSDTMRKLSMQQGQGSSNLIDALLEIFLKKRRKVAEVYSEEESVSNVAFGYISVLICNLCTSKAVRSHVEARLPGPLLQPLLDAVEEFLQFHKLVDNDGRGYDDEGDIRAGFIGRLQSLVDDLKG